LPDESGNYKNFGERHYKMPKIEANDKIKQPILTKEVKRPHDDKDNREAMA
jgi:hypothetical protein